MSGPSNHREHLPAYADGELAPALRAEIERLIAADPAAQAEVQRWRAIRQAANRALQSERVPMGLRARVLTALRRKAPQRRSPILRLAMPVLATAAAILLAFMLWSYDDPAPGPQTPAVAASVQVSGQRLAKLFDHCAVQHNHDSFGLGESTVAELVTALRGTPHAELAAYIPDLSERGYYLSSVCNCSPSPEARALHAHYQRGSDARTGVPRPQDVVSFFAVQKPMRLEQCARMCNPAGCSKHPCRQYMIAAVAGDVTVVKWNERQYGFAVCSVLPQAELAALADDVILALATPREQRTASAGGLGQWWRVFAMVGLAGVALPLTRRG